MKLFKVVLVMDEVIYTVKVWADDVEDAIDKAKAEGLANATARKVTEI